MASIEHISDSESESRSLSPDRNPQMAHTPTPEDHDDPSPPQSTLSHRFRPSPEKARGSRDGSAIAIEVPPPNNREEYQAFTGDTTVDYILEDFEDSDGVRYYRVEFEDGNQDEISETHLLKLRNGQNALDFYEEEMSDNLGDSRSSAEPSMDSTTTGKRIRTKINNTGFVDSTTLHFQSDEDELRPDRKIAKRRKLDYSDHVPTRSSTRHSERDRKGTASNTRSHDESLDSDEGELLPSTRKSSRITTNIKSRQSKLSFADEDEEDELAGEEQVESENSDIVFQPQRQQRRAKNGRGRTVMKAKKGRARKDDSSSSSERAQPSRRSGRDRVIKNMRERDADEEVYADDGPTSTAPKVISIREIFQPVSKQDPFALLHCKTCDVCKSAGDLLNKGARNPLVYCQGCSTAIHKNCLGYRANREHLVTKVGHEHFVMQCRRCVGIYTKKDASAPLLGSCQSCKEKGRACEEFSVRRTAKQEEKLRLENEGEDPITTVPADKINNPENILFRCTSCQQAFHFEHLPSLTKAPSPSSVEELHRDRFKQYSKRWQCKYCIDTTAKVQRLVAWRPTDQESYVDGQDADDFREDEKEYLVKWEEQSYFQCKWMPGSWIWGVTAGAMRKAFKKAVDDANSFPKWTEEEAIPEEFLRIEIVLDVSYDDSFQPTSEAKDKAAIHMVESVYVKFQGLSYDEVAWEEPPDPNDADRWSDFVAAYNEYIAGKYFTQPPAATMKERVEAFRSLNFERKVEAKKQPAALVGGDMMAYQMEGLNWLLYNFHQKKNVILADEMGLGKTIQIIAFLASLVKSNPKCWPFLVVTPNSTCPNWRREIKKWAPGLRVVAYYGGKKARDMAMEYELYPEHCTDLRAHVVVTSYEAPVDEKSKSFFKRIKWQGMIVDEGQRLKNDANLLYVALKALKVPFQVLLTGTPLQNNKRELFNLLQFLDKSMNATELDEKYAELTKENLPELHELIRPFFLRRTKLQVLKFLPPMAQVILPVTMSSVQKRLYRSILSKNGELIKSILGNSKTVMKATERGNLNNILMQLRKCLCHPFVYSEAVEEKGLNDDALHRNLIDASAKLQLLEIMLPKLRERGHRVLLFSQFLKQLDIVEDFLNGLDLPFQRLDGNIPALEKQKRIDAYNAPNSPYFAFILSTRAGGVGINLATADTVIIMDPDFNPHQDIQALSRAHRIGQKNKVLCFQLMTKDSAEEKIVQIGRKKMALDHALIESMGADDDTSVDVESILKHGAEALFNEDDRNDIHYSSASVDKLLDRAQVETTVTDDDKTAESQFSFARVWANNTGNLEEEIETTEYESAGPNSDFWDKLLKEREAEAAAEAARNMQNFGRGHRVKQTVNYEKSNMDADDDIDPSPLKQPRRKKNADSASDLDFPGAGESDADEETDVDDDDDQPGSRIGTPSRGTAKVRISTTPKRTPIKKAGVVKPQNLLQTPKKVKKTTTRHETESSVNQLQPKVAKSRVKKQTNGRSDESVAANKSTSQGVEKKETRIAPLQPPKGGHKLQFNRVDPSFPNLPKSVSRTAKAPTSLVTSVTVGRGLAKNTVITVSKKSHADKTITQTDSENKKSNGLI